MARSADEPATSGRGWGETRNLNPTDQRIRAAGFHIHARPKNGEAIWIDTMGDLWTQAEVVCYLERHGR